MKRILILAGALMLAVGCKTSSTSTNPVLTAIESAGCDVESAVTGAIGTAVVSACKGTGTAAACGAAFQTSLGNVNFCAIPLPATASVALLANPAVWKKLGDIPASALKSTGGVKPQNMSPMGLVGNIACPIGINTSMGYLTAQIPLACGCTISLTASQIDSDLTTACEAAVPI